MVTNDDHVRHGADVEASGDDDAGVASRFAGLIDGGQLRDVVDLGVLLRPAAAAVAADEHGDG